VDLYQQDNLETLCEHGRELFLSLVLVVVGWLLAKINMLVIAEVEGNGKLDTKWFMRQLKIIKDQRYPI
jgi:hypothetical protein